MANYVVSAGESNHGLIGKTNINVKCIEPNTITVDMFGHVFAHDIKYTMVTHARVFALIPKEQLPMNICNFLACSIRKICMLFSYSNMASWNKIKDKTIQLPVDRSTGKPDWKYMDNYISILQKNNLIRYSKDSRKNILTAKKIIASNEPPVQSITKS